MGRTALFALLLTSAPAVFAGRVNLIGVTQWTDSAGSLHPIREGLVELWDTGSTGKIATSQTALDGSYSFSFDNIDPWGLPRSVYVRVLSQSPSHSVSSDGTLTGRYSQSSITFPDIPDGNVEMMDIVVPKDTTAGGAFSVNDAYYTGATAATTLRGAPQTVDIIFPGTTTSYFRSMNKIEVINDDRWDWDILLHEYAHFLTADRPGGDNFGNSPGGDHNFNVSMISYQQINSVGCNGGICSKDEGLRLGWREGLATWLAIGLESTAQAAGTLPAIAPPANDTFYDDTIDVPSIHIDVEATNGSTNAGEANESSVMRILWDMADAAANEAFDTINLGIKGVYDLLKSIPGVDRLGKVWDKVFDTSSAALRAAYGAIFEEYNVAPQPTGGVIGKTISTSELPTFRWKAGNNGANDSFNLIILDEQLAQQVLGISLDGAMLVNGIFERKLTWDEWNRIYTFLPDEPALHSLNFVITGADRLDPTTNALYAGADVSGTNDYWSGAHRFLFRIPEPPTVLLLGLGFILASGVARKSACVTGRNGTLAHRAQVEASAAR